MIIFIFYRDLRLQDNKAFNEAIKIAKKRKAQQCFNVIIKNYI